MIRAVFCSALLLSLATPEHLRAQTRAVSEEERLRATIATSQDPVVLEHAFRSLIGSSLQRRNCDQALQWLNRGRDRKVLTHFASYLLEIGRCLEEKVPEQAREIYQRIIADYPDEKDEIGDSYADSARRRLIWLSDDRSWRVPSRARLVSILSNALRRRDFASLQPFVSKVNFIFGACQSEFLNSDLEEISVFLEENYSNRIRIGSTVRRFPFRQGWFMLETGGWSVPYDYIYLLMQPIPGGWEWIGAIYCDEAIVPSPTRR